MSEDQHKQAAEEQLSKESEVRQKHQAEATKRMESRPTPTQKENDLAALGVHLESHEDDGSGGDIGVDLTRRTYEPVTTTGGYRTRRFKTEETPAS
jgi:hypothetical protein